MRDEAEAEGGRRKETKRLRDEETKRHRDEGTGFQPQSGDMFVEKRFYSDHAPELKDHK